MRPRDTVLERCENQKEALGLVERDSAMSRVSKPSRASAIFVATAASLAAMTAYNVYRTRKAEREHPPTGRFVTVDGVRLHYIERGEGPPVVLLHGNVVTAEDFDTSGVLDLLATRYRVIAFDRPGFGYSDRPHGSAWSARAQADLLRDALVVLGIERPIVLGHSWGAAVVLALALNHPDAVRGLVLVSGYYYPSLRADVLLSSPAAIPILGDLLRYSISPLLGKLMQPLLLKGMFAPLPVPANFAKGSTPNMSVRPGQIRAESQDGVAMIPGAIAMRRRYQELTMPVVIMAGTKDRVVNSKQPCRLHAQIPHSILRLVPDVGHMLHYAVPEEVAEGIGEAGGLPTKLHNIRQASASYTASAA
jgi:pimeloyl-ACP methyl ester carboxylesterase